MAVLSNQLRAQPLPFLDRTLSITLTGPGGGTWRVAPTVRSPSVRSSRRPRRSPRRPRSSRVGHKRADWRDRDVSIAGDDDYAATFLDAVDIV